MKKLLKIVLFLTLVYGCKTPNFAFDPYPNASPETTDLVWRGELETTPQPLWNNLLVDSDFAFRYSYNSAIYDTIPAVLCTADTGGYKTINGHKRLFNFGATWWEFGYVLKSNVFYNNRYLNEERYLDVHKERLDSNIVVLSWRVRKGFIIPTSSNNIIELDNGGLVPYTTPVNK